MLTVAARLDRRLNVPDALHRYTVLVVAVDILVLELANLVQQYPQLIRDIRDVFIAGLTPLRQLVLLCVSA